MENILTLAAALIAEDYAETVYSLSGDYHSFFALERAREQAAHLWCLFQWGHIGE